MFRDPQSVGHGLGADDGGAGREALATTSAGFAFTLGRPDMGRVTRDEALAHAADIVSATPLPSPAISRTALPTIRTRWRKPFGWQPKPGFPAAPSRTHADGRGASGL